MALAVKISSRNVSHRFLVLVQSLRNVCWNTLGDKPLSRHIVYGGDVVQAGVDNLDSDSNPPDSNPNSTHALESRTLVL